MWAGCGIKIMTTTKFDTQSHNANEQFSYWNDAVCDVFTSLDCQHMAQGIPASEGYRGSLERWDLDKLQMVKVSADPSRVDHSRGQLAKSTSGVNLMHIQLAGESFNVQDGREALLKPGDFTICNSTRPYHLCFDKPIEMLVLKIPHEIFDGYFSPEQCLFGQRFSAASGGGLSYIINDFIKNIWRRRAVDLTPVQTRSLADCTLSLLSSHLDAFAEFGKAAEDNRRQSLLKTIQVHIDRHMSNAELSPESVAAANNISARNLRSLFAEQGLTCSGYLMEQRLKAAAHLLGDYRYAHLKVIDIAFRCGFQNASHFSRRFRSSYGVSPKDYRDRCEH